MKIYEKYQTDSTDTMSPESGKQESGLAEYVKQHKNNQIDWSIISHIKKASGLLVIPKGISNYDDAILALKNGADGIMVSNHGGRQLDTQPATLDCLPEVVKAVKDYGAKVPIFFDGGIRQGSDALKAIGMGADAVFIGRPVLYGLAYDG